MADISDISWLIIKENHVFVFNATVLLYPVT